MRAAVCYEFGSPLVVEELELAPPQPREIKVKLGACAICHSDITYAEGAWGGVLPAVYGHECAGIVTEVGPGVSHVVPGEHVVVSLVRSCDSCYYCERATPTMCEGEFPADKESRLSLDGKPVLQGLRTAGFAEYVVVDQSQAVRLANNMPSDSASLLACGVITGLGAVTHTAKMLPGSSAVVIGVGGVGLNAIQGAVLAGGQTIIAVDLVTRKLEAAGTFGATHAFNPVEVDVKEAVLDLTGGRGVDYVFVTVGSVGAMQQGLSLVRRGGTVVLVGMPASGAKLELEAVDFTDAAITLMGSKMGSVRPHVDIPKLFELYQQGRLKLDELITGRYRLEDINEAIASVKRGEALRNVIVFE